MGGRYPCETLRDIADSTGMPSSSGVAGERPPQALSIPRRPEARLSFGAWTE